MTCQAWSLFVKPVVFRVADCIGLSVAMDAVRDLEANVYVASRIDDSRSDYVWSLFRP